MNENGKKLLAFYAVWLFKPTPNAKGKCRKFVTLFLGARQRQRQSGWERERNLVLVNHLNVAQFVTHTWHINNTYTDSPCRHPISCIVCTILYTTVLWGRCVWLINCLEHRWAMTETYSDFVANKIWMRRQVFSSIKGSDRAPSSGLVSTRQWQKALAN